MLIIITMKSINNMNNKLKNYRTKLLLKTRKLEGYRINLITYPVLLIIKEEIMIKKIWYQRMINSITIFKDCS